VDEAVLRATWYGREGSAVSLENLRTLVRQTAEKAFGKLVEYVEAAEHHDGVVFCIHLSTYESGAIHLTFDQLQLLSTALGTKHINVHTQFGYDISDVTPGPSDSYHIEVRFKNDQVS